MPLGTFSSDQFQSPFELSLENREPTLESGTLVYRINCTPRWTLDFPLDFTAGPEIPSKSVSFDPPRAVCKAHATTLRFKPLPDTPPLEYPVTVTGRVENGNIAEFVNTTWVKAGQPLATGVQPNSGSGKRGLFRVFGDDASTGIPKMELLFNRTEDLAHACHVTITHLAVSLTDDDGRAVKTSNYPDYPSIENSQCAIEKSYSFDGVALRFKPAFDGGEDHFRARPERGWRYDGLGQGGLLDG